VAGAVAPARAPQEPIPLLGRWPASYLPLFWSLNAWHDSHQAPLREEGS